MSGRSLAVFSHTLVIAVVGVGNVEDGEFRSPGKRIHGCRGHFILAAVDGRLPRANF